MTLETAVEILSPLNHLDTDCVCRVARTPGLVATCAGCGQTVYRGVHLPLIAFGFYCGRCRPCRTFAPSPGEVEALKANRARADAGSEGDIYVAQPVKPVESVEERRAHGRQRLADAARARWADPVKRAALLKSIRDGMQRKR